MPLLGKIIHRCISIRNKLKSDKLTPAQYQKSMLKSLLKLARNTEFGKHYDFTSILKDKNFEKSFQKNVAVYDYESIFEAWWYRSFKGEANICWPGIVKYFALTSGTSGAPSKHIPVTQQQIRAIRQGSVKQIFTLTSFNLPDFIFEKGLLLLGGSTKLNQKGHYYEGDLSGISASQIPLWFQNYYKPGKDISKVTDWDTKMNEIVKAADKWDIGIIAGVPAWLQILLERIIQHYKVENIHEIWPNLRAYVHGGVSFEPYRKSFEKITGQPLVYIETYLASEGYIAFQQSPDSKGVNLILNNGLFYEFIPFNDSNFDMDGNLKPEADALLIDQVKEGVDYALLLSNCSGAWRYLLGDVVRFTSVKNACIIIVGRTKHFISLCGEHLSVDNMTNALQMVENQLSINIQEFTVSGIKNDDGFKHHWFIGTNDKPDKNELKKLIDENLKKLNDDYRLERTAALKELIVEVLPLSYFYEWMELKGKKGGQNKFPRVVKAEMYKDWVRFLKK